MNKGHPPAVHAAAVAAYADNSLSLPEWARRLGVSQAYISAAGRAAGISLRAKGKRKEGGSASHTAGAAWRKGSDALTERIRAGAEEQAATGRLANGRSICDAARQVVRLLRRR